jgi:LAO/AO transport system kinase
VNKADRDGAGDVVKELRQMLHLGARRDWDPPVLSAIAAEGEGIAEVWAAVREHRDQGEASGALAAKRRARLLKEAESLAAERFRVRAAEALEGDPALADDLAERRIDPYGAAQELLRRAGVSEPG